MSTKNFAALATVALALAGASVTAFAADTGLTREQVRAELARARASGELLPNSESYGYNNASITLPKAAAATADSGKSREQVRAELARARADGTLVPNSESYGYATPVVAGTSRTRAEVRAEAIEAAKAHKSDASYGALSTGY